MAVALIISIIISVFLITVFFLCLALGISCNSDIDWSKSIADIDHQLYKKYGLSQEEIDYIEKTIKPME